MKHPQWMRAAAGVPELGADEVLIAIDTAGVGRWDLSKHEGIPGTDGAGIVVAAGARVRRMRAGDRVYSYSYDNPKGGFWAEYVVVDGSKVAPIPRRLDLLHAGAVATIGLTALQGVDDALEIEKGERLIIHGASGNVGMLALQFAKRRGAHVLAIASGSDGVKLVRRLGADAAVDGKRGDIIAAARKFAPAGVDAVLAFAGGKELTRCLDSLRKGGRVAYPNGVEPPPKKRRGIKMKAYDGTPGPREFQRLNRAIAEAGLEVPIAAVFRLDEASKAYRLMEKGHVIGKIVLHASARPRAKRRR